MPEQITDIKLTVRDVLRSNWDNTDHPEALSSDDIHIGWYDSDHPDPQVTVSSVDEGVDGGGRAGYSAIAGDGSGGIQHRSGTVIVTSWAGSQADYDARGVVHVQNDEMAWEVEDIVHDAQMGPSGSNLDSLSVVSRASLTDDDEPPTTHATQFEVRYTWRKDPPSN